MHQEGLLVVRRLFLLVALLALTLLGPMAVAAQNGATPAAVPATPGTVAATPVSVPIYGYRVVAAYPHNTAAFTEGLAYVDGTLYESTGLEGESTLRRVDLASGKVLQSVNLDPSFFGEGIAVLGDRIYQLTWKAGVALVYDRETFEQVGTFHYEGEGWGLTTDGTRLIMSNGTNRIVFRDPDTFDEVSHIDVTLGGQPVGNLNELEIVGDELWANVWLTDVIARIDPETGEILGLIDLRGLLSAKDRRKVKVDVLNGIAYDPASGHLYVTGKWWPKLFQIELVRER
jgi:glutamine cyclotransferase